MNCMVSTCSNNRGRNDEKISFFSFPKDPELRQKWIDFCGAGDINIKTGRICHLHFKEEDIEGYVQFEMGLLSRRYIRKGAIPCIKKAEIIDIVEDLPDQQEEFISEESNTSSVEPLPIVKCEVEIDDELPESDDLLNDLEFVDVPDYAGVIHDVTKVEHTEYVAPENSDVTFWKEHAHRLHKEVEALSRANRLLRESSANTEELLRQEIKRLREELEKVQSQQRGREILERFRSLYK